MVAIIIYLAVCVLMLVSMWKILEKLGEAGWKSLIPIYNIIVLLQLLKWDLWKIVLFIIPIVNIIFSFLLMKDLAARFGKGTGYAVGLFLLIVVFLPMLAFKEEPVNA